MLAGVVVFAGCFFVWAKAAHPRHFVAPPPVGGQGYCFSLAGILGIVYRLCEDCIRLNLGRKPEAGARGAERPCLPDGTAGR